MRNRDQLADLLGRRQGHIPMIRTTYGPWCDCARRGQHETRMVKEREEGIAPKMNGQICTLWDFSMDARDKDSTGSRIDSRRVPAGADASDGRRSTA